jgi:hypothetical protein
MITDIKSLLQDAESKICIIAVIVALFNNCSPPPHNELNFRTRDDEQEKVEIYSCYLSQIEAERLATKWLTRKYGERNYSVSWSKLQEHKLLKDGVELLGCRLTGRVNQHIILILPQEGPKSFCFFFYKGALFEVYKCTRIKPS